MPDISKQTVSASQMPAIFNKSPYATRWLLYQHFANGVEIDAKENERMDWGKRVEPIILRAAADELRCDVLPHDQAAYWKSPDAPVGCTPDGYAFDPQRGLGFIECKNIDWLRWRDTWTDTAPADHVEIQLQTQLMVPHPDFGFPQWGCVAALIGGNELKLYERQPIIEIHDQIATVTREFLSEVARKAEPDVFGLGIELPALTALYPKSTPDKVLREENFDHVQSVEIARLIEEYEFAKDRESSGKKTAEGLKAKLMAIAQDANAIMVHGRYLNIARWETAGGTYTRKPSTTVKMTASIQNLAADLDALLPPKSTEYEGNIFN